MGDREKMINGMCMTYRHDYGLLEPHDREVTYRMMAQIAYHDVDPAIAGARASGFRAAQESMRQRAVKEAQNPDHGLSAWRARENISKAIAALKIEDPQ